MIDSLYRCKPLVLSFVGLFWAVMLVETMPADYPLHRALEERVDPIARKLGLSQGKWQLFAPEVDHVNTRMEGKIVWEDGTQSTWMSPDWCEYSNWDKFAEFRRIEYFDNIHFPSDKSAWPSLAAFIAREETARMGKEIRMIELSAHGDFIDKPSVKWRPAYAPPEFTKESRFFTWFPHENAQPQSFYLGN